MLTWKKFLVSVDWNNVSTITVDHIFEYLTKMDRFEAYEYLRQFEPRTKAGKTKTGDQILHELAAWGKRR